MEEVYGQSRQKYLWLPEAQNDFIFSVLGEEFGLVGTALVLGLFVFFIYRGYKIAINAKDLFGSLVATRNNECVCTSNNCKYSGCYLFNASNRNAFAIF